MTSIFISYSSKDTEFTNRLVADLEQADHSVWQDQSTLRGGQDWLAEIDRAIHNCAIVILVLSPNAIESQWVQREIAQALNLQKPVIPVLIKEIDNLPFYLSRVHQIDFRHNYKWAFKQLTDVLSSPGSQLHKEMEPPLPIFSTTRWVIVSIAMVSIAVIALFISPLRNRPIRFGVPTDTSTQEEIATTQSTATETAPTTLISPSTTAANPPPTANATAIRAAQQTEVAKAVRETQDAQPTATSIQFPTNTPIPRPTNTPSPAPTACSIQAATEISALWKRDQQGCPTSQPQIVWASWTPYQTGQMLWRDDNKQIYGFFNSGWWQSVPDTWDGQSETPSRGEAPPGLSAPVRGTGHIWGTNDTFYQELGWPIDEQLGFCALVQNFENGLILRSSQVAACKDNLFNQATTANFRLDWLRIFANGSWQSKLR